MPLQVDNVRLPTAVEANAQFALTTETMITTSPNGIEQRFAKRRPRVEATISFGPEYADAVIALYYAQIGPRYAFQVRNPLDFAITDQVLVPDTSGNYPVIRTYGGGARSTNRRIILPIASTIVVKLDDTEVSSGDYTLDDDGIINPSISFSGSVVTIDCEYDTPMRFADDQMGAVMPFDEETRVTTMKLIEVIGE